MSSRLRTPNTATLATTFGLSLPALVAPAAAQYVPARGDGWEARTSG